MKPDIGLGAVVFSETGRVIYRAEDQAGWALWVPHPYRMA